MNKKQIEEICEETESCQNCSVLKECIKLKEKEQQSKEGKGETNENR